MKKILIKTLFAFLAISPAFCYAVSPTTNSNWIYWENMCNIYDRLETDQQKLLRYSCDKRFIEFDIENGKDIFSYNIEEGSNCDLRYNKGTLSISIEIQKPIWENPGELYLQIIDKEGFLIKEIYVTNIRENYVGKAYSKSEIFGSEFSKIFTYNLVLRG